MNHYQSINYNHNHESVTINQSINHFYLFIDHFQQTHWKVRNHESCPKIPTILILLYVKNLQILYEEGNTDLHYPIISNKFFQIAQVR